MECYLQWWLIGKTLSIVDNAAPWQVVLGYIRKEAKQASKQHSPMAFAYVYSLGWSERSVLIMFETVVSSVVSEVLKMLTLPLHFLFILDTAMSSWGTASCCVRFSPATYFCLEYFVFLSKAISALQH